MNKLFTKKSAAIAIMFAFVSLSTFAQTSQMFAGKSQFRTWTFGINAGATLPINPFLPGFNDYNGWEVGYGLGANLRKQFSPATSLGFDANFLRTQGRQSYTNNNSFPQFKTNMVNVSLDLLINVASFDLFQKDKNFGFVTGAGIGIVGYDPKTDINDGNGFVPRFTGKDFVMSASANLQAGFRFKAGEHTTFELLHKMYFADSDVVDGRDNGDSRIDKYSYSSLGLQFALGDKSKPQLAWVNTAAFIYDNVRDEELRNEVNALKGRVSKNEGDINNLKKDTDGDGVPDMFDKEPNTAPGAIVDGAGRTLDTDRDGVPDHLDRCPTVAGPASNNGCPETTVVVNTNTIGFDFDSSVLRSSSFATLDQLASQLKASGSKVTIEGHASIEGTDRYNQRLSERRAKSVADYLIKAGVNRNNITSVGFGSARPTATNETEDGRSRNRRVEFRVQ